MKNSHLFSYLDDPSKKAFHFRTDLACESINKNRAAKGTSYKEYTVSGISVSELLVENTEGEENTGRKKGRYVTVHCPVIRSLPDDTREDLTDALSTLISSFTERLTGKEISPGTKVLVAGLGNRFISADSIGPRTADKISVTAHVKTSDHKELFDLIGCSSICAVHPGVMGQTGIEAAAMIKGAAEHFCPDVIIAVDALAARATKRLCATVQLCDTGIEPGSGIGNRRGAVNSDTIGFPVIALGVPTVVDCATLVYDSLKSAGIDESDQLLSERLSKEQSFFVSLRDSDVVSEEISTILANGINRAFFAEGL